MGVYCTEQLPAESVQVPELKVPEPTPTVHVTDPPGVVAVPGSVSLTTAVQVVGAETGSVAGVQEALVELARSVDVNVVWPELPLWSVSPAYVARSVWDPTVVGT